MNTFLDFETLLQSHRPETPLVRETLIRLGYAPVRRLAACLLDDPPRAAALTPVILQTALAHLPDYPLGTSFAVWLLALTVRVCRRQRGLWGKKQARPIETTDGVLSELPETMRAALLLADDFNLEVTEIAVILHQREGRVQKMLIEGRKRLGLDEATEGEDQPRAGAYLAGAYPTPREPEAGFPALIEQLSTRGEGQPARSRVSYRGEWLWAGLALLVIFGLYLTFNRTGNNNTTLPLYPSPTPPLPDVLFPQAEVTSDQPESAAAGPHYASEPILSGDGKTVVYLQSGNDGMELALYDRELGQTSPIDLFPGGFSGTNSFMTPDVSDDGQKIVFTAYVLEGSAFTCAGGTPCAQVIMYDRGQQGWLIVSTNEAGDKGIGDNASPVISGDGRYVAFWSFADNLVPGDTEVCEFSTQSSCGDLFIKDLETGKVQRVWVGKNRSQPTGILTLSTHGEWLVFSLAHKDTRNLAEHLTPNMEDIFVVHLPTGELFPVNIASDGTPGNEASFMGTMSDDGRYVAFVSAASNLVPDDTNGVMDVFLHDLQTGETRRISVGANSEQGDRPSGMFDLDAVWSRQIAISGDGRRVFFTSFAQNLLTDDTKTCIPESQPMTCFSSFIYDRDTDRISPISLNLISSAYPEALGLTPSFSTDGRWLALQESIWYITESCPEGACSDVYLFDLDQSQVLPVSRLLPGKEEESWHFQAYLEGHKGQVNGVAYSPDGMFASAGQDSHLLLWNATGAMTPTMLTVADAPLTAVAFSPDGKWLAAGDQSGNVCVFTVATREDTHCLPKHPGQMRSLAFSPDGTLLMVGAFGVVRVWRWVEGDWVHVREYPYPGGLVDSLAFSPDGELLAVAVENEVWVRQVSTGEVLTRLAGHASEVLDVAFSPDGHWLASGSNDQTAILWRVEKTGENWTFTYQRTLRHHDWVRAVAFSPDSTTLATGTFDSSLVLWRVTSGQYLDTLRRTTQDQVMDVAFSPDGKHLAAGTVNGVRLWAYGKVETTLPNTTFFTLKENEQLTTENPYLTPIANYPNVETTLVFSLEEAQKLVSVPLRAPEINPNEFTLTAIYVFRNPSGTFEAVSFSYLKTTSYQPATLNITESLTNPLFFDYPLGRYARVFNTSIGDQRGEFVRGGWNLGGTTTDANGKTTTEHFWDDELASLWLRWQDGSLYFSMLFDQPFNQASVIASEQFSMEEFFSIAESLK